VYVQASQHETFCLAVLEAMSAGLPVVVTQSTGMSYLLKDGANGYVVSFGDSKMLAERLKTLLDDEALRCRIGQTNITRAREINWDASAKLLAGCFQSLYRGSDGRQTESSPLLAASKKKELQP
jgi:glycosyltransferase involved in cell wall biosynthesis